MRKRLRSKTNNPVEKVKKQCFTHTAQRKFAANVPLGSVSKEALQSSQSSTRKTEDFIDFLCFRSAPYLTPGLEVFAEPIRPTADDEIFESEMVEMDTSMNSEEPDLQEAEVDRNAGELLNKSTPPPPPTVELTKKEDKIVESTKKEKIVETTKKEEKVVLKTRKYNITNIDALQPSTNIFKDIFLLVEYASKKQQSVFLLTPPSDWKALSYVQDDLAFKVKTKHIHRLMLPVCDNFVVLHCIKKQLEKDCVKMNEIPLMGLCEIDLAHMMEIVDLFGGVETVNSDQNWKALADQLCIPKNASRRVSRLEDIYLTYILPYALQPDSVKNKIKQSVLQDIGKLIKIPKGHSSTRKISLEAFHRMACNGQFLYWRNDASYTETEEQLWKLVNEGSRHVTATCGEIDLNENPQAFQNPKCKVPWKHSTVYSLEKSALRYVGKLSEISAPKLIVEGTFWVSDWSQEAHGFHTLSYLHSGAEKIWYVVPKHSADVFRKLNRKAQDECSFLPPEFLLSKGCSVLRCVQKEGQYVVVEPGCYYCTLSTGYSLSEVVCLAPMDWFASDSFKGHMLVLEDFVVVKAMLNYAIEEGKIKTTKDPPVSDGNHEHVSLLIEKLEELRTLVTEVLVELSKRGIENISYLKNKPNVPQRCSTCGECCYLFSASIKNNDDDEENDEDNVLCVNDAIKMVESKRVKSSDIRVSALVSKGKINQLREKLKSINKTPSPKKKKSNK